MGMKQSVPNKEVYMSSIDDSQAHIQTSPLAVPALACWWGELVLLAAHLKQQGILTKITEQVRFARHRFGRYEVIDFLVVLFGYALSGERTLESFYAWVRPFATIFMALFGRDRLPSRSALSRFLAALPQAAVEALRALFLQDLLARPLCLDEQMAGLWDRHGCQWRIFDVDGTREAARQRALPQSEELPAPRRRLENLCAAGYTGRKRGEVVRTRTVVSQVHSAQWLGSFANRGNGQYREELRGALSAIESYLAAHQFPKEHALLRLDGQYGTGAVLADLAGYAFVTRGKDYAVLDLPEVQTRLHLPPDQHQQRPESQTMRALYTCLQVPVGPQGQPCRVVVATHPAGQKKSRVGVTRKGIVYELFFTNLPQSCFTAVDVVELYLHRGAFEPILADEDEELDPDRWCSHTPAGQQTWQIIAQWLWNLRLELGHQLAPTPLRNTTFAPAISQPEVQQGYQPPVVGGTWKVGRFSGEDFVLQPDGTMHCPEGKALFPCERRVEQEGSLRIVYEARIADCRICPKRPQCQWHGSKATKPRRVSVLLHPLRGGKNPLLWRDWPRRQHRQACMQLLRRQQVDVRMPPDVQMDSIEPPAFLSRAQRAHYRLSWAERRVRNARLPNKPPPTIILFGVPDRFASFLGLKAG
jgi:hypothetical protein